jgi:hypothetical protein
MGTLHTRQCGIFLLVNMDVSAVESFCISGGVIVVVRDGLCRSLCSR